MAARPGRLAGLRVLDLTLFLPGPMVGLMLTDQGADVLKIEPPGGDPARAMAPFEAGQSVWFRNLNRGKQAETIDLKSDAGRARLWSLIDGADVLLEGFRPGAMARLGFAPQEVLARNPRIVVASLSAFGQDGPLSHHPAHDLGAWALSGFLSVNDAPDGTPVVPGVPAADMALGLTACSAVLMALLARERGGQGAIIDCAMLDSLLPWSAHVAGPALVAGAPVRSAGQRSLGGHALYRPYACADGRHIVLCGREEKFARTLLCDLGRPDLLALARLEPGPAQAPLHRFLEACFAARTRDQWVEWFQGRDIAFAPVLTFAEAFAQPHVAHRGLVQRHEGAHHLAPAIRFADDPPFRPAPAPDRD